MQPKLQSALVHLVTVFCIWFVLGAHAATAGEYRITFFAQHGSTPKTIEIDNGGEFSQVVELTKSQVVTIPKEAFAAEIESFFVTASYQNSDPQSFELRLLRPGDDAARLEKSIFLSEPGRFLGENYVRAVVRSKRLFRSDRRKAYVPFFQCRESYFTAVELGDKQTAIDAMECWISASHRMVFADPSTTRRMFAPDPLVFDEFASLMDMLASREAAWLSGLNASQVGKRDLERLTTQIEEMKLYLASSNFRVLMS